MSRMLTNMQTQQGENTPASATRSKETARGSYKGHPSLFRLLFFLYPRWPSFFSRADLNSSFSLPLCLHYRTWIPLFLPFKCPISFFPTLIFFPFVPVYLFHPFHSFIESSAAHCKTLLPLIYETINYISLRYPFLDLNKHNTFTHTARQHNRQFEGAD